MMSPIARCAAALLVLVAILGPGSSPAQDLQIIELRHRLAADLIPVLEPLLEPGGALSGADAVLFVRTSPANLEQIRQAIALLDRQSRQLLVSVGQGTVTTAQEAEVRGAASVGNDEVQVGVNRPPGAGTDLSVHVRQGSQRTDLHDVSRVQALEGTETFIAIGLSAPVTTTQVSPGWGAPTVTQTTEYRSASTGFYATARLNGDLVTIEISPQQQRTRGPSYDRHIETAGLTTRVSGRLGEWMRVGGVAGSSQSDASGLLSRSTGSESLDYGVWVKVEELPSPAAR